MSFVTSLSHAEKKRKRPAEGLEGQGEITLRSHLAVVMAVLTGVIGAILELEKPFPWRGEAGEHGGDIGLVMDFAGEANAS